MHNVFTEAPPIFTVVLASPREPWRVSKLRRRCPPCGVVPCKPDSLMEVCTVLTGRHAQRSEHDELNEQVIEYVFLQARQPDRYSKPRRRSSGKARWVASEVKVNLLFPINFVDDLVLELRVRIVFTDVLGGVPRIGMMVAVG